MSISYRIPQFIFHHTLTTPLIFWIVLQVTFSIAKRHFDERVRTMVTDGIEPGDGRRRVAGQISLLPAETEGAIFRVAAFALSPPRLASPNHSCLVYLIKDESAYLDLSISNLGFSGIAKSR